MDIINEFLALNIAIQKEFAPLSWVDITHYDNGTGSVSFTDTGEEKDENEFFDKMVRIKQFIQSKGFTASLVKFPSDKLCNYPEARIDINFYGGEL